jgi:hypothetical protein
MPSQLPVPTVEALRKAFAVGVQGDRSENADLRTGSIYDLFGGIGALIFRRLALRDRDIFRAAYFDFAEGDSLGRIVERRFSTDLFAAAPGTGHVHLARPTAAGGAGTFWRGTRITVLPETAGDPLTYVVRADTPVGLDTTVTVDIESADSGAGGAIDTLGTSARLVRIEDELWDTSWQVVQLVCGQGSAREKDHDCRARIKKGRADTRVGYAKAITDACVAAGAADVALFASDFLATNPGTQIETVGEIDEDGYGDTGLNRVFVADASGTTPLALLQACRLAVDRASINGMAIQVFGMAPVLVTLSAELRLWGAPARFSVQPKMADCRSAIINHFATRQNPFYFRLDAIRGAILQAVRDVQTITLTSSYTLPDDTPGTEPTLPSVLASVPISRFYVTANSVTVSITGP